MSIAVLVPLLVQQPPRDQPLPRAPSGTAEVAGRVLAEDTGLPLSGARVSLTRASELFNREGIVAPRSLETGADGSFSFAGLPAGDYWLTASDAFTRDRYLRGGYKAQGSDGSSAVLTVKDGQRLRNVDITLSPAAVIAGRVTDEQGDPLARIMVMALRWTGSRPVRTGAPATTDDLGQYRLFGLTPGDYVVAAEQRLAPTGAHPSGLLLTYSPEALGPGQARQLQVVGGQVTPADIRMVRSRLFQASGLLLNARGEPVAGGSVTLTSEHGLDARGISASTNDQGRFFFRNLAPGTYRLVGRAYFSGGAPPGSGRELSAMDLRVHDDLRDLVVMSQPGATVRIDVQFETAPPSGAFRLNVQPLSAERGESLLSGRAPESLDGPGTVTIPDLFGAVLFRISGLPPRWAVKAVRHHGRDVTDVPTVFNRQDAVQIVVSDRTSTVEGTVRAPAGPGDRVLVFGDDPEVWIPRSSRVVSAAIGLDGRFVVHGLRAGTYYIVALRARTAAGLTEPSVPTLHALTAVATRVVVGAGETREIDVPYEGLTR